mmetsp:Transcript_25060/g.59138  ORF Transcript_25060/g.59138 Transcript_25060/m.59138 type:complete len:213 (-) Transcript_25060:80-718(-)
MGQGRHDATVALSVLGTDQELVQKLGGCQMKSLHDVSLVLPSHDFHQIEGRCEQFSAKGKHQIRPIPAFRFLLLHRQFQKLGGRVFDLDLFQDRRAITRDNVLSQVVHNELVSTLGPQARREHPRQLAGGGNAAGHDGTAAIVVRKVLVAVLEHSTQARGGIVGHASVAERHGCWIGWLLGCLVGCLVAWCGVGLFGERQVCECYGVARTVE